MSRIRKTYGILTIAVILLGLCVCLYFAGIRMNAAASGYTIDAGSAEAVDIDPLDDSLLYAESGTKFSGSGSGRHRFADNSAYFTYKIALPEGVDACWLKLLIKGRNALISISTDDVDYTEIGRGSADRDDTGADFVQDVYSYFDVTPHVATADAMYLRFAAADTSQGFGAAVYSVQVLFAAPNVAFTQSDLRDGAVADIPLSQSALSGAAIKRDADNVFYASAAGDETFVVRIRVPNGIESLVARMELGGYNAHIEVSADGERYATVGAPTIDENCGASVVRDGMYFYDLSSVLSPSVDTVYLRFGAFSPALDTGTALYALRLYRGAARQSNAFLDGYTVTTDAVTCANEAEKLVSEHAQLSSFSQETNGYRMLQPSDVAVFSLAIQPDAVAIRLAVQLTGQWTLSVSTDATQWYAVTEQSLPNEGVQEADITRLCTGAQTLYVRLQPFGDLTGSTCGYRMITAHSIVTTDVHGDGVLRFAENAMHISVDLYNISFLFLNSGSVRKDGGRYASLGNSFIYCCEVPSDADGLYALVSTLGDIEFFVSHDGIRFVRSIDKVWHAASGLRKLDLCPYVENEKVYVMCVGGASGGGITSLDFLYTTQSSIGGTSRINSAFAAGTAEEEKYLQSQTNGVFIKENPSGIVLERQAERLYRFDLTAAPSENMLYCSAGGTYLLSVSFDGVTYTDVCVGIEDALQDRYYAFDRGECAFVYVRFTAISDAYAELGGMSLSGLYASMPPTRGIALWAIVLIVIACVIVGAAVTVTAILLVRRQKRLRKGV